MFHFRLHPFRITISLISWWRPIIQYTSNKLRKISVRKNQKKKIICKQILTQTWTSTYYYIIVGKKNIACGVIATEGEMI